MREEEEPGTLGLDSSQDRLVLVGHAFEKIRCAAHGAVGKVQDKRVRAAIVGDRIRPLEIDVGLQERAGLRIEEVPHVRENEAVLGVEEGRQSRQERRRNAPLGIAKVPASGALCILLLRGGVGRQAIPQVAENLRCPRTYAFVYQV
jgi:hypothetical protein